MGNRCSPYKSRRRSHAKRAHRCLLAARKLGLRSCFHPAVGRLGDRMRDGIRERATDLTWSQNHFLSHTRLFIFIFIYLFLYCITVYKIQGPGLFLVSVTLRSCPFLMCSLWYLIHKLIQINVELLWSGNYVLSFNAGSCVIGQLARFPFQFVGIMQLLDKKLGEA